MARCLSGEASVAERDELMKCVQEDVAVQQQYEIMSRLWQEEVREQPLRNEDVSEEERKNVSRILQMAEVQQAMEKEDEGELIERTLVRRPSRIKRIAYITSGIAATILGIWLFKEKTAVAPPVDTTQVIVAQKGTRTQTILPDGSVVWLNAGSKITYQADFEGPLREVKLEGEAYFDVKKEKAKPFIVHANGVNIKVLGTAFNVKSYPSDKTVETTLIRGLVQLSHEGNTTVKPIYLHPDEKIIVNRVLPTKGSNTTVAQVENKFELVQLDTSSGKDYIETAWLNNRLAFHGDSFEALAQKLERWYNVTIMFEDEEVKKLNFNGSFENETVGQAFKALAVATPFTFKIKGHEIYVGSTK